MWWLLACSPELRNGSWEIDGPLLGPDIELQGDCRLVFHLPSENSVGVPSLLWEETCGREDLPKEIEPLGGGVYQIEGETLWVTQRGPALPGAELWIGELVDDLADFHPVEAHLIAHLSRGLWTHRAPVNVGDPD